MAFSVDVVPRSDTTSANKLFFLNLGGYKPCDLEEYHFKLLTVAANKAEAITSAKQTAFYLHTGFKGATSHIDDKYGVDVDDIYGIEEVMPKFLKEKYAVVIDPDTTLPADELHIGYLKLSSL